MKAGSRSVKLAVIGSFSTRAAVEALRWPVTPVEISQCGLSIAL